MSRVVPLDPPYSPEVAEMLDRMPPPGRDPLRLFRTIAHHPPFLDAFRRFGGFMLARGLLADDERELVIQRTTALCGADYEWAVHATYGGDIVGLGATELALTWKPDAAGSAQLSERQRLLIALADELHRTSDVSDALWAALAERWNTAELIELVALVGQYHLVSYLARVLRVQCEPETLAVLAAMRVPTPEGENAPAARGAGTRSP